MDFDAESDKFDRELVRLLDPNLPRDERNRGVVELHARTEIIKREFIRAASPAQKRRFQLQIIRLVDEVIDPDRLGREYELLPPESTQKEL